MSRFRSSALALVGAGLVIGAGTSVTLAAGPGDSRRFDTWTGYDVGRFPVGVAARDFNADGFADAAWIRDDFFEPSISVQLNLADGTLGAVVTYPVTANSTDIDTGDLDGDGDVDLVVVGEDFDFANPTVDLYLNDGTGDFTHTTTQGGVGGQQVVVAELTGDLDPDLALTSYGSADFVSILQGNGDGTFRPEKRVLVGRGGHGIEAADLDGDGDRDLAVVRHWFEESDSFLDLLANDGTGGFALIEKVAVGSVGIPNVAAARLDNGTLPDLVISGWGTADHLVLLNGGAFSFSGATYQAGYSSGDLALADVDGDGDTDIASATFGSSDTGDLSVLPNRGDGTFGTVRTITSSNQPMGVAAADFTGDGRLDIATANRGTGTGVVHVQLAAGQLAAPPAFAAGISPTSVATGDLDGDADVDVITTSGAVASTSRVDVLLNDGTGTLTQGDRLDAAGDAPTEVTVADLDGNGSRDLVWLVGYPFPFVTALNNGDGTFATPVIHAIQGGDRAQLTVADVDGDGDRDVLVTDRYGSGVSVGLNDGSGGFTPGDAITTGFDPEDVKAADLDHDGDLDLVTAHNSGNGPEIRIIRGLGQGTFGAPEGVTTDAREWKLILADLDGDTWTDIVALSHDDTIEVIMNDGAGGFGTVERYAGEKISGYLNGSAIAIGDLNDDGRPDLVTANRSGNDVSIDWARGSGLFERRQVRYGMNRGPRDVALADLDGDGALDVVGPNSLPVAPLAARSTTGGRVSFGASPAVASTPAGGVSVVLNRGASSPPCTITGTIGDDTLVGTSRADVICALGGNDTVRGAGGNDRIVGGPGRDTLIGGAGNDVLLAGPGRDLVMGGPGADLLRGGDGADTLRAADGVRGNDVADGGDGTDSISADPRDSLRGTP